MTLARTLSRFAIETQWNDLPQVVQHAAVRSNLNWLGCALAGSQTKTLESALSASQYLSDHGNLSLIGRSEFVDPSQAAFLNCLSSAAHAFDDTHLQTITHPTGPVAAVVWALAEQLSLKGNYLNGKALMRALAIGMEIECRLSNAIVNEGNGAHIGWYMTGLTGGMGAAVAASLLLNLSEDQTVTAMSLAAVQAGGLRATHGSMATAFVPAMAARNGLAAARLVQAGFTSNEHTLDGKNGLLAVLSEQCNATLALSQLGHRYEILDNAFKPYPCGIVIHPSIDACIALHQAGPWAADDIESVSLWVHEDTLRLCGRVLPHTLLDAQVSVFHWAAATLIYPTEVLENAELNRIQDQSLQSLQQIISVQVDKSLQSDQARARLRTRSGREVNVNVDHATASAANPMTDSQLNEKFTSLAMRVFSAEDSLAMRDLSWDLPNLSLPIAWLEKARVKDV